MTARATAIAVSLGTGVGACNLAWGIGDLTYDGTGASTAAGTTTGAAGSGGAPPGELCLNGTDDDHDGFIDCSDAEDCGADYECVPPPGIEGQFVLLAPAAGACPYATSTTAIRACTACSCTMTPGECSLLVVAADNQECINPTTLATGTTCASSGSDGVWVRVTASVTTEPSCTVDASSAAPADWLMCGLSTSGTCANGQACVPRAHGGPRCVQVAGDGLCPLDYPTSLVVFSSQAALTCTCGCQSSPSACADVRLSVWSDEVTCSGPADQVVTTASGCTGPLSIGSMLAGDLYSEVSCAATATSNASETGVKLCCPAPPRERRDDTRSPPKLLCSSVLFDSLTERLTGKCLWERGAP